MYRDKREATFRRNERVYRTPFNDPFDAVLERRRSARFSVNLRRLVIRQRGEENSSRRFRIETNRTDSPNDRTESNGIRKAIRSRYRADVYERRTIYLHRRYR